jgi:hypothetical protein
VKATVNGTAVMTFSCALTDSDLALTGVPADITTNATSPAGAAVTFAPPTAVDEDTPLPVVTCDHAPGSVFPIGTTTVTCSATDADDTPSTVSASFHVTVADTDLALAGVPGDITIAATSAAGAAVSFTPPTAVDEDSPVPVVTCDHASGATFPVGTTTVTCSATDADDTPSTVSGSFTVSVTDSDLALANVPADLTVNGGPTGATVSYTPPTAVDEDAPLPVVTCDHASGSTFPVGTTTVTCSATDADDTPSTVSASFSVTVNDPDTDLALTNVPADLTVNGGPTGATVSYTPPTAVDEDAPLPVVTCDHASGSTFPVGTTTVTCSATDADDTPSTVSASFTVTVNDPDTDLALTGTPADITIAATSAAGASVSFTPPTAVDEDSPLPVVTCDHASGSVFPVGTTTVTCSATDADDTPSTVSTSFHVTVTVPPDTDLALTGVPGDITVSSGPAGTAVTYTPPTAVDEDTPVPPVTCDHASGSVFPVGTTTVTCSATDADDTPSTVSASFTVTVNDPPSTTDTDLGLTGTPADITVAATSNAGAKVTYTPPAAVDEDTPLPAVTCDHQSGAVFPVGTTAVTCSVTDTDDTPSTVSATFHVTVTAGAQAVSAQLAQLDAAVHSDKPLRELVKRAEGDVDHHDSKGACRALDSFIDEVHDQHGPGMTKARAADLIAGATRIEAALGCPKPSKDDDDGHARWGPQPTSPGDEGQTGTHDGTHGSSTHGSGTQGSGTHGSSGTPDQTGAPGAKGGRGPTGGHTTR